jgi:hypothetical protein
MESRRYSDGTKLLIKKGTRLHSTRLVFILRDGWCISHAPEETAQWRACELLHCWQSNTYSTSWQSSSLVCGRGGDDSQPEGTRARRRPQGAVLASGRAALFSELDEGQASIKIVKMSLSICLRIVEVSASPAATLLIIPRWHACASIILPSRRQFSVTITSQSSVRQYSTASAYTVVYIVEHSRNLSRKFTGAHYKHQVTRGMNMLPFFTAQHYDDMMRLGDLRARSSRDRARPEEISVCDLCAQRNR